VDLIVDLPTLAKLCGVSGFQRTLSFRCAVVLMVGFSAAFLACDLTWRPIVLWDESRLAVNALEMSRRGFSLVTTFGFQPDLYNTKPPLLIWLEAGSISLFGPSEWAVRLPSFLAALATIGMVMRFSWRLTCSRFVAIAAPTLLLFSPGFFGRHAAHSGDYEALLCFFTTAYVLLLFKVLHQWRPDPVLVLVCGLLIAGACLTKGIAGLVPGVGVFVYVLVRARWPRLIKTPWYALAGLIVVVLVGGFYLLRERAAPGYLGAVAINELGGRFLQGKNGHLNPWWYYIQSIIALFAIGPAVFLVCAAPLLRWKPTKPAAFVTYANLVVLAVMVVFSLSRTKIYWYIVPVYPIVSISLAIVGHRLLQKLPHRPQQPVQTGSLIVAALAIYMVADGLDQKLSGMIHFENIPQSRYGQVFAQLDAEGLRRIRTLDGGVANDDDLSGYTPQLYFYDLVWRPRGLNITAQDPSQPVVLAPGEVLVTCDPGYLGWVQGRGPSRTSVADCAAVASRGR